MNNRNVLVVKVARLFYKENKTQTEISNILGLSRPTVATMLKEAIEKGIVKISIQDSEIMNFEQQETISTRYSLKSTIISSSTGSEEEIKVDVASLCATFIENKLDKIESLGIGWGSTLYEVANAADYRNFEKMSIVPLIGGVDVSDVKTHSNHLAFVLAQKFNCKVNYFYAPAIAESLEMKEAFEKSKFVKEIIRLGQKVDMAVVSVGNPIKSSSFGKLGYLDEKDYEEMNKKGTVGDILTTFYDGKGVPVELSISERMIGVDLNDLSHIKEIVVVASGIEKAESIKVLLKKNLIDHLIIDSAIANYLLDESTTVDLD